MDLLPRRPSGALPPPPLACDDPRVLQAYFQEAWSLNERLFAAIEPGALYARPDPLRHPLIFYYGHTAAFYVNKLTLAGLWARGVDPELEQLFAKGVDPAEAAELPTRALWPERARVAAYRAEVHARVSELIEGLDLSAPAHEGSPQWALHMGLEHARIHFETSSVLLRQLPAGQLRRPEGWRDAPAHTPAPARRWLPVPARRVTLGRGDSPDTYAWDNELGRLALDVPAFEATAHLVTNQDFLGFVAEGGYDREDLWTAEGWRWRQGSGARAPRFWLPGAPPRYRAQFDEQDMPWSWPVEVNAHEAEAWCRWAGGGARLPTEAEWTSLRADAPLYSGDSILHPGYNLNLRYGSPCPVDHLAEGRTASGFYDVYGNVWQWLADDFRPLPGFAPHPLYADFSAPYFDAEHAALGGGSWASTGTSASRWYRLWFRRHFTQHAGFRAARGGGHAA